MNQTQFSYKKEELFLNLVEQFHQSALIYLGKIVNPQTQKMEINLQLAEYFINMLKMLENKTIGNLTKNETEQLHRLLLQLEQSFNRQKQDPA